MNRLLIADDEGRTTVVPLLLEEVTVGRKEGNTIRLTERNVSRRHARLYRANGAFKIEDLGSANGTKVNGVRLRGQQGLKVGDQIQIGDYRILLEIEDGAAAATPDAAPAPGATAEGAATTAAAVRAEPAPIARLVLLGPPDPGREFVLDADEMLVGRADHCKVCLDHPSLSREHARILRSEAAFRIVDLQSHNGIRVNDQDVPVADLRAGDVVELGHVRARFVAPGEDWMFIPEPVVVGPESARPRGKKTALLLLAGAFGILLVGGATLLATSGDVAPVANTGVPTFAGPTAPAAPAMSAVTAADPAIALERARGAIAREDWSAARSSLAEAGLHAPGNTEVRELLRKVDLNLAAQPHFEEGVRLIGAGDPAGAFAAFSRIDVESDYRGKPQVAESVREWCARQVGEARRLVTRDPIGAKALAQGVLAIPDAPNRERGLAQGIVDRLAGAPPAGAAIAKAGKAPAPQKAPPAPATARPAAPVTDRPAAGGMEAARECLGRGDQQCVIRALANPRSEREYELLAMALQQSGQSGRAAQTYCQAAARFAGSGRRENWIAQASRLGRQCPR